MAFLTIVHQWTIHHSRPQPFLWTRGQFSADGQSLYFWYGLACVAVPWTVWPLIYKHPFHFLVWLFRSKNSSIVTKVQEVQQGNGAETDERPTTADHNHQPMNLNRFKCLINGDAALYLYVSEDSQPCGIELPSLQRQSLAPCLFLQDWLREKGGERVFVRKLVR